MGYEDEYEFEDDTDLSGTDLVKSLRKQLNAAQKALREKDEYIQELVSYTHEQTVSEMLAEYGLNPKIARFIPDDVESEADLVDWLNEYGDAFGVDLSGGDDYEDDPSVEAANLMAEVEEGGMDPEVGFDLATRIENAGSADDLLRILGQA